MARAFIAKSILNIPSTVALIDRLKVDKVLRRLCGFEGKIPCEGTFSNAFLEFAEQGLAAKIHDVLISEMYADRLVGHISRDATAIESREKVAKVTVEVLDEIVTPLKRGRPKKMMFALKKS
jgi:hypothetical protein